MRILFFLGYKTKDLLSLFLYVEFALFSKKKKKQTLNNNQTNQISDELAAVPSTNKVPIIFLYFFYNIFKFEAPCNKEHGQQQVLTPKTKSRTKTQNTNTTPTRRTKASRLHCTNTKFFLSFKFSSLPNYIKLLTFFRLCSFFVSRVVGGRILFFFFSINNTKYFQSNQSSNNLDSFIAALTRSATA